MSSNLVNTHTSAVHVMRHVLASTPIASQSSERTLQRLTSPWRAGGRGGGGGGGGGRGAAAAAAVEEEEEEEEGLGGEDGGNGGGRLIQRSF